MAYNVRLTRQASLIVTFARVRPSPINTFAFPQASSLVGCSQCWAAHQIVFVRNAFRVSRKRSAVQIRRCSVERRALKSLRRLFFTQSITEHLKTFPIMLVSDLLPNQKTRALFWHWHSNQSQEKYHHENQSKKQP